MEVFENWLAELEKNKEKKTDKKESKKEKEDAKEKKEDKDKDSSPDVEMEDKTKKEDKKDLPPDTVPGLGFKDKVTAESTLKELEGRDPDYQKLAVKGLIGRAKRVLTCTRDETKISNIKEAMSLFDKFLDDFDTMHLSKQNNPYISLGIVRTCVGKAEGLISEQQKSFIEAYSSVNGEYKRLRTVSEKEGGKTWDIVRNAALKELKEKYADAKLFDDDEPTKEHLEMLLWAYSPEQARVKKTIKETKEESDSDSKSEEESNSRKRRSSARDGESPSKKKKE
ncbi:PREDICTED: uncharacterized protein LOC106105994 isoform X2 [Papilio polytes]|nr:PREDICTED: uncharacterized protein LOC106105994 isoform X2 [Papilio polytes]